MTLGYMYDIENCHTLAYGSFTLANKAMYNKRKYAMAVETRIQGKLCDKNGILHGN